MDHSERTITLPPECWPLSTLLYDDLTDGYGRDKYALTSLRNGLEECVAFLHKLPHDATPADIDIVSEFSWSDEKTTEIMRLCRMPT